MQVGKEGEEYFLNEDGTWDWIADLETVGKSVLPNSTMADGGTAPGIVEADFQLNYIDESTRRLVKEMLLSRENAEMPYPLVTLTPEDETRIAELQAKVAPYTEQQLAAFVTGDIALNDENWETFQKGLQDRGLQDMIDLWQKYVTQ